MIDLEKIRRIKRIATRRYNKVKKEGEAIDRLNYLSAKLTSTAILENIENGNLKPSVEEYEFRIKDYDRMFK